MLSSELIVCKECGQVSVSRERHKAHLSEPRHINHYRSGETKRLNLHFLSLNAVINNPLEETVVNTIFMFDDGLMFSGLWLTKTPKEEIFG